jgi:anaerobic magnesium-protoporphyrin IX monomethyl ester cyclase
MKALLIDPPYSRFMNYYRYFYPLGLTYVARALKNKGHQVKTYDAEHSPKLTTVKFRNIASSYNRYIRALESKNHKVWSEVRNTIAAYKPDIVGISSIAPCKIGSTFKVAEISKKYDSDLKIIVGGQLSAASVNDVLNSPHIDFVVRGEGEITAAELLDALENNGEIDKVKGISFKKRGKILHTPDRPFVENLDSLGFPYIESLIELKTYRPIDLGIMMTSRGCAYACSFCGLKNFWGRRIRWRSEENVIEEIVRLKEKHNVRYLCFRDACFTFNRKRTIRLCKKLVETNLEMKWECTTRIDLLDSELIQRMKEAGCQKIRIGIESGSDRMLKSYNKKLTTNVIKEQAQILKKHKMTWLSYFMFGAPDETEEDMIATMNLIKEIEPSFVTVGTFYPIPGTEIFEELKDHGELPKDLDYNKLSMRMLNTHYMRHLTLERYQKLMKKIVRLAEKINRKHYSHDPVFSEKLEPQKAETSLSHKS